MAIVFVSPKKRQLMVVSTMISLLVAGVAAVGIIAFFPELKSKFTVITFDGGSIAPREVNLNFTVIDSPQVKELQPFLPIQTEFSYTAEREGKKVSGKIMALDIEAAKAELETQGFALIVVQQPLGRTEPFIPY